MTGNRPADAKLALPICAVIALAGCTVGPEFVRPAISTPVRYAEASLLPGAAIHDPDGQLAAWWTRLGDPVLDDLIRRALTDNPDLKAAAARVREARLDERVTAAAALPSVSASGNVLNLNTSGAPLAGLTLPAHTTLYSAGFDASWEVDLFGGTRRAVEAAKANTAASDWARRDGQVSLVAEVANDYLTLRILQSRIALGKAEVQRQQGLYQLIHARRVSGFVTQTDVNQEAEAVVNAAAQLQPLGAEAQVEIHALGVLVGQPPESLINALHPTAAELPLAPIDLPLGLPSDLLRRRPDIREAEQRLAAASAQIGVSEAALYPKLNLLALASFGSPALGNLFAGQNLVSAGVGMVSQPIFDGGRARANIAIAKEKNAEAIYAYQTTVFNAFRDVENALARYNAENARRIVLARSVVAGTSDVAIAQDRYRTGFATYVEVLRAQAKLLTSRDQLVQSNGQILIDLISLYKALGGGWAD
jgi:NodT family efflux transporter outer membrane factor (OMF) lipoprotein